MTLIVGDIHGCYEELQDLLEAAGVGSEDQVVSVGDAIHRGPDSLAVLDFFRDRPNSVCLLGNHERKHLRTFARGERPRGELAELRRQLSRDGYDAVLETFRRQPRWCQLTEALVVHAAVEPNRPLPLQDERVLTGSVRGEQILAARYRQPWWELYDRSTPVVVGHRDFRGDGRPFVYRDRVFGLDTGCVRGGRLTGLLLPEFRLISVPSRRSRRRASADHSDESARRCSGEPITCV